MSNKEYFADTTAISNSQLRTFVSYNKYGQRLLTPDDYISMHIEKTVEFNVTDPIVVWKIVDKYFDGTWKKVWDFYIPVAKRTGKEIQAKKEALLNDFEFLKTVHTFNNWDKIGAIFADVVNWYEWLWEDTVEAIKDLIEKYVDNNFTEITMSMKDDAEDMIKRGINFKRFKEFLKLEWTSAQNQLRTDIEITDELTWEIHTVTIKWLPDFVNEEKKLIVDLKTTWSLSMVIDDLQFRWEPKLTANYIRQLSMYNKLMGGWYDGALAVVTANWVKWISIPNEILENAWEILEKDILDLAKFLKNPESIDESIFTPCDTMIALEDLSL